MPVAQDGSGNLEDGYVRHGMTIAAARMYAGEGTCQEEEGENDTIGEQGPSQTAGTGRSRSATHTVTRGSREGKVTPPLGRIDKAMSVKRPNELGVLADRRAARPPLPGDVFCGRGAPARGLG